MNGNAPADSRLAALTAEGAPARLEYDPNAGFTKRERIAVDMAKAMVARAETLHYSHTERMDAIALSAVKMADALLRALP